MVGVLLDVFWQGGGMMQRCLWEGSRKLLERPPHAISDRVSAAAAPGGCTATWEGQAASSG